jgi:hypothetical protein
MQFRVTGLTATALGAGLFAPGMAAAQTLDVTINLPRMTVAEYHKPYVAVWIEKQDAAPKTLAVWYDVDKRNNAGTKWLRDVRLWWRASGRSMSFPAAGVTGATRGPGGHKLSLNPGPLAKGAYVLVVEAAREAGGREMLRLPFTWNGSSARATATGKFELGAVAMTAHR